MERFPGKKKESAGQTSGRGTSVAYFALSVLLRKATALGSLKYIQYAPLVIILPERLVALSNSNKRLYHAGGTTAEPKRRIRYR